MKIHKEYCPIYLASEGKFFSTLSPFCYCDELTQSSGSDKILPSSDGCGEPEHNPEKLNKMSPKDLKELWKWAESEIIEWESFIQKIKKELRERRK